ncbi:hypothetical protein GH714_042063 [Hevea brasiliensis]|uniref:F-box domain-containing protein n=1 Tax=Hevea brasiliensis TaxID=3981 RepID=A0A6A6MS47_HEVBR|nr:hypothetical protein GH714_042063 [Hevea brasiliensis]
MTSFRPDPTSRIYPEPEPESLSIDHFDRLPDSLLLLVFNKIGDVKALGRCCVVSRRFHSLVPQVDNVVVRVDCVISDDDTSPSSSSEKSRSSSSSSGLSSIFRLVFCGIVKPFHALGQLLGPRREMLNSYPSRNGFFSSSSSSSSSALSSSSLSVGNEDDGEMDQGGVTHHSPTQVLKNFNEIRFLRIELPGGELGIDDGVLLKWRADFGSTLDNCVILGAASVINNGHNKSCFVLQENGFDGVGMLITTTTTMVGVLCMNREQLEELRVKPLSASSASKRTLVPALNMRLWYAPYLELPDGLVLKGATLVAIRPSEQSTAKKEVCDASWVSTAFEEPYGTAAKMLVKRRTYCLEMNSF